MIPCSLPPRSPRAPPVPPVIGGVLAALALLAALPAAAQDDRRVSTLEKQVRELRAIVFQGRDTGQPVVVKPEGPDPIVTALQARVDALEDELRQLTGRLEVTGHDLDETRRGMEQARAETAAARQALSDRVAKLEAQATQANQAAPPPAPAATPSSALPAADDPTSRAQAGDTGRLGGRRRPASEALDSAPPPAVAASFEDAQQRFSDGDYAGAEAGFGAYLAKSPSGLHAPEAHYQLGQTLYARASYPEAARDYAVALKGWPRTKWAPDATVKLAQALVQLDRSTPACQALGEFDRRYAATATAAVKARAAATRARAACPPG